MISNIYKEFMLEQKFRNNTGKTIEWYQDNLEKFFIWLDTDNPANLSLENFKQYGVYLQDNVIKHNGDKLSDSSVQLIAVESCKSVLQFRNRAAVHR